jgi:hypothetical protein
MPKTESLDELISKKAVEFADQIKAAASMADKEEEIRIEAEKQLAFIQKEAGIKLEGKHEFTVASGRVDSVYSRVIIEYKNPKSPGDHIGPRADSPGSKKVVEQIKKRFYDMRREHGQPLNSLFGVGLDGNHFIFVRFRDEKWQVQEPVEVNKYSAERFLWALFNLGQKGKPFSPEYLTGDFGSEGGNTIAIDGIHALYDAIVSTNNPKAKTFFSQWKILFGEVCGYDVDHPSDKIKNLAKFYQVGTKGLKPAELLFAVHTYYALFMKLLASEIVAFFHKLPTPLQKMMQAGTSNKLRREMEDLEAGSIFRHLNITNFLEGDLFAWYTAVWSEPIGKLVRNMVARLDDYNPGTLSEDPAGSRDLLKKLYQQLFPKSVRHDLGEYYTPDWLAEHVLNELGYDGDPDKRFLDPGTGSGTFLVMAINRILKWYEKNREKCAFGEDDLCRKILLNVIGFDLNPLAVMAARTNYLIAIRGLIGHVNKVEIPVYLCDSILTPSEYGDLFTSARGTVRELKTAAGRFMVPAEIAGNRESLAKYADQLEFCVKNAYSPKEFIARCRDEGLLISAESLHADLYNELVELDKANKNGVWARIIKNAFAPLFIGEVDYIAGNPPWVNWESLPESYRDNLKPLWQGYDLFTLSGSAGRMGGGKKDLSMLFVYSSVDNYLRDKGRLGFVITQTVFKTKGAGDGFRRFSFSRAGKKTFLAPIVVHDLSELQVFEGASNRTAVLICQKTKKDFAYPVPYVVWSGPSRVEQDVALPTILQSTGRRELGAVPIDPHKIRSPWLTVPARALKGLQRIIGESKYKAYAGCCTWMNGVYWVRILRTLPNGNLLIQNLYDVGKIKVDPVETEVEPDLVYPLLRGRDVRRWSCSPTAYIILSQNPATRTGITESEMRRKYPKTFAYFKKFEAPLRGRSGYRRYFDPTDPFYCMYNVGTYTLAPIKVFWRQFIPELRMVLHKPGKDPFLGTKLSLTQHVVSFVPFETDDEALFFAGMGNSSPATLLHWNSSTAKSYGQPHILQSICIPRYALHDKACRRVVEISSQCHRAASKADSDAEAELDKAAAQVWDIPDDELAAIQSALQETRGLSGANQLKDSTTEDDDGDE